MLTFDYPITGGAISRSSVRTNCCIDALERAPPCAPPGLALPGGGPKHAIYS